MTAGELLARVREIRAEDCDFAPPTADQVRAVVDALTGKKV